MNTQTLTVSFDDYFICKDNKLIDTLLQEFTNTERVLTQSIPKYHKAFSMVLANLKQTQFYEYVYIRLDNNIKHNSITTTVIKRVLNFLNQRYMSLLLGVYSIDDEEKRSATQLKGYPSLLTKIRIKKLKSTKRSFIVLKDKDKKVVRPFRIPTHVKQRDKLLIKYNKLISSTTLSLDGKDYPNLNPNIRAIYNNSDFEHSGRFYGGRWQSEKSKARKRLLIDNTPIKGYDLKNALIRMAIDKYNLDNPLTPIAKAEDYYAIPHMKRAIVKKLVNIMLNLSKNSKSNVLEAYFKDEIKDNFIDSKYKQEVEFTYPIVVQHFQQLINAGIFFRCYAMELMNFESKIAEAVIQHFTDKDIPVLTVHDSYYVQEQYSDELERVINEAYLNLFGVYPKLHNE